METITVRVGTVESCDMITQDLTREVQFVGEKLGHRVEYGVSERTGGLTNTRGTDETLYRTKDGRLVVYVERWSKWQGEPTEYELTRVTEADLGPGGMFEHLGRECGFGRPLSLDEALGPDEEVTP